ncbi:MAG: SGNH/GDSL hydrolase family protein [Candidatus Omnitrophica bacterium]|nr:SGNH/GDSL hydrolase family protein [Candidatus Omnitrophota bacterium]
MNGIQRREEFEYPIRINEHGMRNRPVTLDHPKGVFRIAFLGDSFVWGIGVSDEERFTDIIGKLPSVESLNFGVSGYGPVQYLLFLDNVIRFKPDLVILTFCLSNDFGDNIYYNRYGYYKPYAMLMKNGGIEIKGYPIVNVNKFGGRHVFSNPFLKHSRLLRLIDDVINKIRSILANARLSRFDDMDPYRYPTLSETRKKETDRTVLINKLILAKIKQKLDRAGIPLVILAGPTKYEYPGTDGRINANAYFLLEKTAKELGIDLIDAVHYLTIHDFWAVDYHYNPHGHEKIADLITGYLHE